ncbi:MAG: hypothetical protein ACRDBG_19720 [Waterburya sp.]
MNDLDKRVLELSDRLIRASNTLAQFQSQLDRQNNQKLANIYKSLNKG